MAALCRRPSARSWFQRARKNEKFEIAVVCEEVHRLLAQQEIVWFVEFPVDGMDLLREGASVSSGLRELVANEAHWLMKLVTWLLAMLFGVVL